ncbi:hypothetical protein [Halobacteriovorax sp. CON-3]|uniref:hypothetical protein n=1 Tax=Halobacteriovorax sp. CON-3 TaxID=3157710 RepID=UPI003723135F
MKALKITTLSLCSLFTFSFDDKFEDFAEMDACIECVMVQEQNQNMNSSGGSYPGMGIGMGGSFTKYGVNLEMPDEKAIASAFAKNQLQHHISRPANDTVDLESYFASVDPKNELSRSEREKLVTEIISNSTAPYYEYNVETNTGFYKVNPAIERLIRSAQASGYIVDDESYKDLELAKAYITYEGDVDGLISYLKENYKGAKLAKAANQYPRYIGMDANGNLSDDYYKLLKLSLESGGLDDTKVMQLIRQEILLRSLGGKPSPISDLISKHIDVAESYRNGLGDNLACEFAKGVYLNTDHMKETISSTYPAIASSGNMFGSYEQQAMMEELKSSTIFNNMNSLLHYQALGGSIDTVCADGMYPRDYLEVAHREGLLANFAKEELISLGLVQDDCYKDVSRLDLAKLCDAASIAYILERQTNRNLQMSERTENSNVKHNYNEGRNGCSISVLDNIVRKGGKTVDREVEVLLNSDEVILRTKSMEKLKASINSLYGDQ